MEYKVLEGQIKYLQELVNEAINDGWFPIGGVACIDNRLFYQAMVKDYEN